jgi:hypothetical protein
VFRSVANEPKTHGGVFVILSFSAPFPFFPLLLPPSVFNHAVMMILLAGYRGFHVVLE